MSNETKFLLVAIVTGAIVYLIPLFFGKAWLGLFLLLVVAMVFLGIITGYMRSNVESKITANVFSIFALMIVLFHSLAFAHNYGRKDFQKDILIEIRQTIEEGITKAAVRGKMIYVLAQYHQQDGRSLIEMAEYLFPDRFSEDGIFIDFPENVPKGEEDMAYFYQFDVETDQIVIHGISRVVPGQNSEFNNYDGLTGMFENKVTLSKKGVNYEVLN